MKKSLFLILIIFSCHSNSNSINKSAVKDEVMFPFDNKEFTWKGIEKQDDALKEKFIKQAHSLLKDQYEFYTIAGGGHTEKEFKDNCHVVDINDDGLNDIVYTGSTGGEGTEIDVFLNNDHVFEKVLKQLQYIVKLEFKDNKLFRLYVEDDGCCDEWIDFNRIYQVDYKEHIPKFNTIYLTSNMNHARFPKKYFSKPIYFEILNDNYKMHLEPTVEDTILNDFTYKSYKFKEGNVIDTLMKGTKGRAIAEKSDKTGRIWWLVEIDSTYKAYGHLFYEQDGDSHKASKIGWISSRYVKRLMNN